MSTHPPSAHPVPVESASTEVRSRPATWTAAQRLAILTEYEAYPKGDPRRGALLRRHGRYTSQMATWRAQRDRGALARLEPRPVGRPAQPRDLQHAAIARLRQENIRVQAELDKAQLVLDIQKKVATLLGLPPLPPPTDAP